MGFPLLDQALGVGGVTCGYLMQFGAVGTSGMRYSAPRSGGNPYLLNIKRYRFALGELKTLLLEGHLFQVMRASTSASKHLPPSMQPVATLPTTVLACATPNTVRSAYKSAQG